MVYQGKVVIIERPVLEANKGGIELLPEAQKAKEEEFAKKWNRLKVHAIGEGVTFCKPGDEVLITPKDLTYCDMFELNEKVYFVVPEGRCIAKY